MLVNLPVSGVSSGSSVQTRIITSIAAIAQSPVATTSASGITTATASTATVAAGTMAVHLTAHQQTLLARVEGQMRALASNAARTPEQERFLQLLMNAQRQIHAQGRCQLQAALTGAAGAGKTSATTTANAVSITTTPTKTTAGQHE